MLFKMYHSFKKYTLLFILALKPFFYIRSLENMLRIKYVWKLAVVFALRIKNFTNKILLVLAVLFSRSPKIILNILAYTPVYLVPSK